MPRKGFQLFLLKVIVRFKLLQKKKSYKVKKPIKPINAKLFFLPIRFKIEIEDSDVFSHASACPRVTCLFEF